MRKVVGGLMIAALAAALGLTFFGKVFASAELWKPEDGREALCGSRHPIRVEVWNLSFGRLQKAEVTLEVWQDGRGRNVLEGSRRRVFDIVVPPLSRRAGCYSDPLFERWQEEASARIDEEVTANSLVTSIERANIWMPRYEEFRERATVSIKVENATFR